MELSRTYNVAVEGNIGCGKSTFLQYFQEMSTNIEVSLEPINMWNNVKGHKLFEIFYADQKRWSSTFQSNIIVTLLQVMSQPQKLPVRLFERSVHSCRSCFIELMNRNKLISDPDLEVLDGYYNWGKNLPFCKFDLIVYLRCSPEVCAKRIRVRDRPGENEISMDYLRQLHDLHEDWLYGGKLKNCPAPVLTFDCDEPLETLTNAYYQCREQVMCGMKS